MYGFTRGESNNNPCNIRISNNAWKGKIVPSKDKEFEQFDTAINGIRAGGKIFSNYYRLYSLSTVKGLISKWAPPSDNNPTDAYISLVCRRLAVDPDTTINVCDAGVLANLITAVIHQENGRNIYSSSEIEQGIKEAL